METKIQTLIGAFALLGAVTSALAQGSITYNNPLSGAISAFGTVSSGSTATYGVVITAPAGSSDVLNDFTFDWSGSGTIHYQADVFAWNGTGATGSALFSQNNVMTGTGGMTAVTTTATGGVTLTPGSQYVLCFTTSDPTSISQNGSVGGWSFGKASAALPAGEGGAFAFMNNTSFSQLTSGSWSTILNAAFTADFNVVATPEPSTLALAGLSGLGMFWQIRRRK